MKKRVTALALALCLVLTACGGREDGRGQGLFQRDSEMEEDKALLTVDGREVPAWRYLYWLRRCCGRLQEQYRAAGLQLDWNAPVEGGTLADYVKDQALADTALYATVENWADLHGCTLDEEDLAALESAWTEKAAEYGRAAEAFARLNTAEDQRAEFAALAAEGDDPAGPRTFTPGDGTLDGALEAAAQALEEGQCSGILETGEGFSILLRGETDRSGVEEAYFDHLLQKAAENAPVGLTEEYKALDPAAFAAWALEETD